MSALVLTPLAFTGARVQTFERPLAAQDLPQVDTKAMQVHALELAPQGAEYSTIQAGAELASHDLRKGIYKIVHMGLPAKFKKHAFEIAHAVINEASHHKMDPFFLLAVIKTESHFRIDARGTSGEIGLMQVRPQTAKWLAAQAGLSPEKINLYDPATNIRIGATYVSSLRKTFAGYSSRYIAAYNMGPGNVQKLVAQAIEPDIYPSRVIKNYHHFYRSVAAAKDKAQAVARARSQARDAKQAKLAKPSSDKLADRTDRRPAMDSLPSIKLETRSVAPKCRTSFCPNWRHNSVMPNWTST